jgi:hypothetical protein
MATADQGGSQRADEERPQVVLQKRLSSARSSCCVRMFALIVYQTWKSVKRALSLASPPREAPLWLMLADRDELLQTPNTTCPEKRS